MPGTRTLIDDLVAAGAEPVDLDLARPASLEAALAGVDRLFAHPPLVAPPNVTVSHMSRLFQTVGRSGVERVVLATNMALPADPAPTISVEVNRHVEDALRGSGLPSVVLRPTLYLGNLIAPWSLPRTLGAGEIAYPLPEHTTVSWLAPQDAAAAAIAALTVEEVEPEGLTLPLGGPNPVTGSAVAAAVAAASGRPVSYVPLTLDEFGAGLGPVLGEVAAQGVVDLYRYLGGEGASLLVADPEPVVTVLGTRPGMSPPGHPPSTGPEPPTTRPA